MKNKKKREKKKKKKVSTTDNINKGYEGCENVAAKGNDDSDRDSTSAYVDDACIEEKEEEVEEGGDVTEREVEKFMETNFHHIIGMYVIMILDGSLTSSLYMFRWVNSIRREGFV